MTKVIKSVSVDVEDVKFMDERGLSASRLLRMKILEVRQGKGTEEKNVMELNGQIRAKERLIDKYARFIDKFNLQNTWVDFTRSEK